MTIEIEIPDIATLIAIPDEEMAQLIEAAVRTDHWNEYSGIDLDLRKAWAKVIESAWNEKPARSLLAWLKVQTKRDDVIGDLTRDVAKNPDTPQGRSTKGQWRRVFGGAQHLAQALDERGLSSRVPQHRPIQCWIGRSVKVQNGIASGPSNFRYRNM